MRRHLVRSAAAVLALVPALSACTVTLGDGTKISTGEQTASTPAALSTPAPASAPAPSATPAEEQSSDTPTPQQSASETAPAQDGTPSSQDTPGGTGSGSAATGKGQKIDVPAGSGIKSMELIDLYGGDTGSGAYGRAVGVFQVTTDRPMLIKLRVQLFDAAGREIAVNDGLNPAYRVGTYQLVTSNLVELPKGVRPTTFKVTLLETTDMEHPSFSQFDRPRLTQQNGVPALTGTFTYSGEMRSGMDAHGACVLPDGRILEGQDGLTNNETSASGSGRTGTYVIPLYDAKDADVTKARCYASI